MTDRPARREEEPDTFVRFRRWDYDRGVWTSWRGVWHLVPSGSMMTACGRIGIGNHIAPEDYIGRKHGGPYADVGCRSCRAALRRGDNRAPVSVEVMK